MSKRNFGVPLQGRVQPNGYVPPTSRASSGLLLKRFKAWLLGKKERQAIEIENASAAEARWPKFQVIQGGKA
jgi:hypothetical protein